MQEREKEENKTWQLGNSNCYKNQSNSMNIV